MFNVFVALALTTSMPAANFHSWFAPEIADSIVKEVVNEEYHEHLDYNGDGKLDILDAIGVMKRYNENIENGNKITLDEETVQAIIEENYKTECVYWEIDFIDSIPCRKYEYTTDKITSANIYLEFEDDTIDNIEVEINPFKEIVSVLN